MWIQRRIRFEGEALKLFDDREQEFSIFRVPIFFINRHFEYFFGKGDVNLELFLKHDSLNRTRLVFVWDPRLSRVACPHRAVTGPVPMTTKVTQTIVEEATPITYI